jgi:hypothetical protein
MPHPCCAHLGRVILHPNLHLSYTPIVLTIRAVGTDGTIRTFE